MRTAVASDEPDRPIATGFSLATGSIWPQPSQTPWLRETRDDTVPLSITVGNTYLYPLKEFG